jgi:hypothetical protein
MKLLKRNILFIITGCMLFSACKKEEVPTYGNGADGVYFLNDTQTGKLSKNVNFATIPGMPEEATINVRLRLLGNLYNDDEKRVILRTKAVEDYPEAFVIAPEVIFGAKEYEKEIEIRIRKPEEINKTYASTLYIVNENENDNIGVGISDRDSITFFVDISVSKPKNWDSWGANEFFGEWSAEKHIFLINISQNPNFISYYDYGGIHVAAVDALRSIIKNNPDEVPNFDLPFVDYNKSYRTYAEKPAYWNDLVSKYFGPYDSYMFGAIASSVSATVKTENQMFSVKEDELVTLHKTAASFMFSEYNNLFYRGLTGYNYMYAYWIPLIKDLDYTLSKPACWSDPNCGALLQKYYGEYSEDKYRFMINTWLSYQQNKGDKFVLVQMFPVLNEYDKETNVVVAIWDYTLGGEDAIRTCYNAFKEEYNKNPSLYTFTFPDVE